MLPACHCAIPRAENKQNVPERATRLSVHKNTKWNIQIQDLKLKIRNQMYEYKKNITQSITKPVSEDDWTITQSIEIKNETYKYKT